MLPYLALLVILSAAGSVESSCTEISLTNENPLNTDDGACFFNGSTLAVRAIIVKFYPECMMYECVRPNVIEKCGIGYNDDKNQLPTSADFPGTCKKTINKDCTFSVSCVGIPLVFNPDEEP
ncbi:uncharacterized protein LOC132553553 [Ylistrum balloti]|uniref:uncharacterized protein LOC132553553 n=1 Tax=Ylistrum balloti TaxID=509963 RepID=UPI002905E77C|nr:uncharacterized protein LOC132553553 [Ylistrum balloti]